MVKQIPDRILKGMVLSAIEQGNHTTADIRNHLATVPYYCDSLDTYELGDPTISDYYTYENYGGLRRELTFLRHQGYLRKLGKKPPHRFELTKNGIEHANNPFLKYNFKRNLMIDEARRTADAILGNDDRFKEAVKNYMKNNAHAVDLGDKKTNQIEHSNEDVRIVEKPFLIPENNIQEVDFRDGKTKQKYHSNEDIKAVADLKAVAEEQATRIIEYENAIRWYQSQDAVDNAIDIKQLNKELSTAERIQKRQALAYEYLNNNYLIDIQFFKLWGGNMIPVTIKKVWDWHNPFSSGSVEIMSRGNREFSRGHAEEMDAELILNSQFCFYQEVENGIELFGHGMTEPKLLKW